MFSSSSPCGSAVNGTGDTYANEGGVNVKERAETAAVRRSELGESGDEHRQTT